MVLEKENRAFEDAKMLAEELASKKAERRKERKKKRLERLDRAKLRTKEAADMLKRLAATQQSLINIDDPYSEETPRSPRSPRSKKKQFSMALEDGETVANLSFLQATERRPPGYYPPLPRSEMLTVLRPCMRVLHARLHQLRAECKACGMRFAGNAIRSQGQKQLRKDCLSPLDLMITDSIGLIDEVGRAVVLPGFAKSFPELTIRQRDMLALSDEWASRNEPLLSISDNLGGDSSPKGKDKRAIGGKFMYAEKEGTDPYDDGEVALTAI